VAVYIFSDREIERERERSNMHRKGLNETLLVLDKNIIDIAQKDH